MNALIVEDDAVTRRLMEKVLVDEGIAVSCFADAETAWAACQEEIRSLTILDWMLPGMDGLELCHRIRALPQGDSSFILIMTSRGNPGDLERVLKAGADDYIAKPVDVKFLKVRLTIAQRQVESLTRRKRAESELEKAFRQMAESHDDLLSILGELRVGTALAEENATITFLSKTAQDLLGIHEVKTGDRPWPDVFPFSDDEKRMLAETIGRPKKDRTKQLVVSGHTHKKAYRLEVEVCDDPRNPGRKIFLFYDISAVHDLRRQLDQRASFRDIIGGSEKMLGIYQLIQDLAPLDTTVLIEGETGTGKELVARAIHSASRRQAQPFIALNCAGLTESLITSQLFGHKRGSFTGAFADHKGVFESAHGGTLFLDEIGEIPLGVQSSLLRVLESREINRLGEATTRKVNVRVISATNRDLTKMADQGQFRKDLLYRLRVARISVPALRNRREDIPLLVDLFLRQMRSTIGKTVSTAGDACCRALLAYPWPGNVRELRNAIEFGVIRCRGTELQLDDVPPEIANAEAPAPTQLDGEMDAKQATFLALKKSRGNRSRAAKILGVSRATLYRRLASYGNDRDEKS